jgi:hypothetical protein
VAGGDSIYDPFTEALGTYVGPAGYDDAVTAIASAGAIPGVVVLANLTTPSGELIWHRYGPLTAHFHNEANDTDLFVVGGRDERSMGLLLHTDVPLVLDFARDFAGWTPAERYTGGLRLSLHDARVLTVMFWQSVEHVTPSGDVVPGFGFRGAAESDDEPERPPRNDDE